MLNPTISYFVFPNKTLLSVYLNLADNALQTQKYKTN